MSPARVPAQKCGVQLDVTGCKRPTNAGIASVLRREQVSDIKDMHDGCSLSRSASSRRQQLWIDDWPGAQLNSPQLRLHHLSARDSEWLQLP